MNDTELRDAVTQIQDTIFSELGVRLGATAEQALAKTVENVASRNLSGTDGFTSRDITILLADLRGFTSLSATCSAATVLGVLNRCLTTMSEIVFGHQGTIDKFMGDSIMVIFGGEASAEDQVRRAVSCAVDLQIAMDELNAHSKQLGLPDLYLGIGINTGPVMSGTLGSNLYATHTVIGDEVNLAASIEAFSLRGQVLISESSFACCSAFVETGEPITVQVKGKAGPVVLREVLAIPSLGKAVPRREIRRSPRVEINAPFSYQVIENDAVLPEMHHGMIVDIGYHGVLAEIGQHLAPLSEIKLNFDLPLIGGWATDIYAKIVKMEDSEHGYLSGLEFTSLNGQDSRNIQRLVQVLIQGCESK